LTVIWPVATRRSLAAGDYPLRPRLSNAVAVATVQFSRVAEGDDMGRARSIRDRPSSRTIRTRHGECRSLKAQQHAGVVVARTRCEPHRRGSAAETCPPARFGRRARPDPFVLAPPETEGSPPPIEPGRATRVGAPSGAP